MNKKEFLSNIKKRVSEIRKLDTFFLADLNNMHNLLYKNYIRYNQCWTMMNKLSRLMSPERKEYNKDELKLLKGNLESIIRDLKKIYKSWSKITGDLVDEDKLLVKLHKVLKKIEISKKIINKEKLSPKMSAALLKLEEFEKVYHEANVKGQLNNTILQARDMVSSLKRVWKGLDNVKNSDDLDIIFAELVNASHLDTHYKKLNYMFETENINLIGYLNILKHHTEDIIPIVEIELREVDHLWNF